MANKIGTKMSVPNSRLGPADEVTGNTIRRNFASVKISNDLVSGKKFRLVFKRKKVVEPATARLQASALKISAQVGTAFCAECQAAKA